MRELHKLIAQKNYNELVSELAKTVNDDEIHPELNQVDENGNTITHIAAKQGDVVLLEYILAAGPYLDIRNNEGKLAKDLSANEEINNILTNAELPVSAWHGDLEKVKELITQGRNPHKSITIRTYRDFPFYVDAFHCAKFKAHAHITEYLQKIKRPNTDNQLNASDPSIWGYEYSTSRTGLFDAISDQNYMAIKSLVHFYHYNVNAYVRGSFERGKYEFTLTPLALAISLGNPGIVSLLLELGAQKDSRLAEKSRSDGIRKLFDLPPYKGVTKTNEMKSSYNKRTAFFKSVENSLEDIIEAIDKLQLLEDGVSIPKQSFK